MVRLSASILTSTPISFTGSIEVDIAAEDISAEFSKIARSYISTSYLHIFFAFL